MESSDTICIALSGRGCKDISVCSKRGRKAAAGRGACIVDHRSILLGACGGASTGGRFCDGVGERTGVPVCGGGGGVLGALVLSRRLRAAGSWRFGRLVSSV